MAVKFFGQFLVEKGAVSRTDLLKAIDLQDKTNLKFGEMVVALGLMTTLQIAEVHHAQRGDDLQFGDMAIKLGFLSTEQVQQVLTRQRNNHLYIGEALIKVGALTADALESYLKDFKLDQNPYIAEKIAIPAGVHHQPIWEMVADLTYKMLTRIVNLSFRTGPCVLIEQLPSRPIIAEIGLSGEISARYLLSATANTRVLMAKAILDEPSVADEPVEVLDDAVMEFINIVCGNIVAKAAQSGYQIDISPPAMHTDATTGIAVPPNYTGLLFPIYLTDGEVFELTVLVANE